MKVESPVQICPIDRAEREAKENTRFAVRETTKQVRHVSGS